MASKQDILYNLREYSSDQLAEAIRNGVVTMYELSKSGNLTPLMRKRIEAKLSEPIRTEQCTQSYGTTEDVSSDIINNATDIESDKPLSIEAPIASESEIKVSPAETDKFELPPVNEPEDAPDTIEETAEGTADVLDNKGMFKRPFSFHGRIRRTEYCITFCIYMVWDFMLRGATNSYDISEGVLIFYLLTYIPMMWFLWAEGCKRCHDRGNSGWYQIIPFYFIILLFGEGVNGDNEYGNNPKE